MEYTDKLIMLVYLLVFYSFNDLLNITDGFMNEFYWRINIVGSAISINDMSLYFLAFF
jgi:hypothetical protein